MKTNLARMAILAVAAVAMAVPALAGGTQAEREMSKENATGKAKIGASAQAPDWFNQEYREAIETGNLLSVPEGIGGSAEVFTTSEYGVSAYRGGIDTP